MWFKKKIEVAPDELIDKIKLVILRIDEIESYVVKLATQLETFRGTFFRKINNHAQVSSGTSATGSDAALSPDEKKFWESTIEYQELAKRNIKAESNE